MSAKVLETLSVSLTSSVRSFQLADLVPRLRHDIDTQPYALSLTPSKAITKSGTVKHFVLLVIYQFVLCEIWATCSVAVQSLRFKRPNGGSNCCQYQGPEIFPILGSSWRHVS